MGNCRARVINEIFSRLATREGLSQWHREIRSQPGCVKYGCDVQTEAGLGVGSQMAVSGARNRFHPVLTQSDSALELRPVVEACFRLSFKLCISTCIALKDHA